MFSDYIGADRHGAPVPVLSAEFCGQTVELRPLTTEQVLLLHATLLGTKLESLVLWIYSRHAEERPEEYETDDPEEAEAELEAAVTAAVRIVFPAVPLSTVTAFLRVRRDALRLQVRHVVAFLYTVHDWKRILDQLLRFECVDEGKVKHKKPAGGKLSSEAGHLALRLRGGAPLFEMLQWRPEAYLSEMDAFAELSRAESKGSGKGDAPAMSQEDFVRAAMSAPSAGVRTDVKPLPRPWRRADG